MGNMWAAETHHMRIDIAKRQPTLLPFLKRLRHYLHNTENKRGNKQIYTYGEMTYDAVESDQKMKTISFVLVRKPTHSEVAFLLCNDTHRGK